MPAKAKFSHMFSDHCVLQREKEIRLFGSGEEGVKVMAKLCLAKAACEAEKPGVETRAAEQDSSSCIIKDGTFLVTLPAMAAAGPFILELYADGALVQTLSDVMIGEVYLAGGQSNMEYELQNDGDFALEKTQLCENVRFYQVGRRAYFDDAFFAEEEKQCWWTSSDANFGAASAVGYYFAKNVSCALENITVGMIGCNWGGTSASAWQSKESLLLSEDTSAYQKEYEEILASRSEEVYEAQRAEYLAYAEAWQPKMDAYYKEHPCASWEEAQAAVGPCKWPGPMGPKHEFRPCGLYETMFLRVVPYTLGGFLYYQGESDEHKPEAYYTLLKNLIAQWRKDFMDESLPFINVQLPMHRYHGDAANERWCPIRAAQMQLHKEGISNGLAVCIDLGEYNNIHPIHKKEVGRRLALQALCHVFHKLPKEAAYGPILRTAKVEGAADAADAGGVVRLTFDYALEGIVLQEAVLPPLYAESLQAQTVPESAAKDTPPCPGLELAGQDGIFYPATICTKKEAPDALLVSAKEVSRPVAVRYLWIDYAPVSLFGKNGLPVAPFYATLS